MGIDDVVKLFMGVKADEAAVRGREETFLELYEAGHYGPESGYDKTEYLTHDLAEWIFKTRPLGLTAAAAGEDYDNPAACDVFIGTIVGGEAYLNPRDMGYWVEIDVSDLTPLREEVARNLEAAFDIVTPPRLYLLRHVS